MGLCETLAPEFPDLAVEDWSTPFLQSLERCRVYVADHLETTYIEALAANKPTILFYDPAQYRIREEAKPYYDGLASAGILHTDPESAAATLDARVRSCRGVVERAGTAEGAGVVL